MVLGTVLIALLAALVVALFALTPEARATRFVKALFDRRRWRAFLDEFSPQAPPVSLRAMTKLVGSWTSATFVQAGGIGATNHILDEAKELKEIVEDVMMRGATPENKYELGLELADIQILLMDIAFVQGVDLTDFTLLKHHINTQRRWSAPDERGVQHHIEPEIKGDISRTEEEIKRLKKDWKYGEKKLAAVLAKADPAIAAAIAELLNADEPLGAGFEP